MKYLVLILTILAVACTPATTDETMNHDTEMDHDAMGNHIGCQEGEIDAEGNCLPAEENTAGLFEQDLSTQVTAREVTEPIIGYLAEPATPGTYPGVVMIHEWWGLNENIKYMAELLASEGYVVYAVDLYDGEVATESSRAGELAGAVRSNPEEAVAKMEAAVNYLRNEGSASVGSMGWCFGGQQSLQVSLNEPLNATVIYYGNLVDDPNELQNLNGPVLGIFGSEDTGIPVAQVQAFEAGLDIVGVENSIHIYESVGHAFANPSGSRYAAEETVDAWEKTVAFLEENLHQK